MVCGIFTHLVTFQFFQVFQMLKLSVFCTIFVFVDCCRNISVSSSSNLLCCKNGSYALNFGNIVAFTKNIPKACHDSTEFQGINLPNESTKGSKLLTIGGVILFVLIFCGVKIFLVRMKRRERRVVVEIQSNRDSQV